MTITEMQSAIQQIQTQLAALNGTSSTSSTSSTSAANASSFASALSAASDDSSTTSSTATGQDVVNDALKYVGVPYVLGGESTSGMDCSGLVQKVFSDLGVSVPRLVHQQATVGTEVDSLKDAKPGDIITLNGNDHVVIYMGNNTVIHAPYEGRTVSVQKIWFDQSDITSIRRIVPSTAAATTATSSATSSTSGLSAGTLASAMSDASQLAALTGDSSDLSSLLGGSSSSSSDLSSLLGGSSSSSSSTSSTSSYLSSLLSSLGVSGATGSSTASQLLAARAALLEGSAS